MSSRKILRASTRHTASHRRSSTLPFPSQLAPSPKILIMLLALSTLLWSLGCTTKQQNTSETKHERTVGEILADAPPWVTEGCRAFFRDAEKRRQVVCGIGSSPKNRNRLAARDTAIARARAAIARSLEVTIESLVRLDEGNTDGANLKTISHQLSSTSLRGAQLESVWQAETGEVHALVSLDLDRVQKTVRNSRSLAPAAREDLARRAADAFAELDAAFASEDDVQPDESRP
jgi:hypothetical protein